VIQQSRFIPPTFGRYLASNLFCEMPPWCVGRSRLVKIEDSRDVLYEAYMRGKVSLVFYKSMMAEKDLFKHTLGQKREFRTRCNRGLTLFQ